MQGKLDNFDLLLPDWLYYTPKRKAGAPSQAARLNPVSAVNEGVAWQSTTSPYESKKCKTLIFDNTMFYKGLDEQRWVAIIAFLQSHGFNIYICRETGPYPTIASCQESIMITEDALAHTRPYQVTLDAERLAKHGVSRSHSVFISGDKLNALFACLNQKKRQHDALGPYHFLSDVTPYHLSIPHHIRFNNAYRLNPVKISPSAEDSTTINNLFDKKMSEYLIQSEREILSGKFELLNLINEAPWNMGAILADNSSKITYEVENLLLEKYPLEANVIVPICYKTLGFTRNRDINYALALAKILPVAQFPFQFYASYFDKIYPLYPDIEVVFTELLLELPTTRLLNCFPHRYQEIFAAIAPPLDFNDLLETMKAAPSIADVIFERFDHELSIPLNMTDELYPLVTAHKDMLFKRMLALTNNDSGYFIQWIYRFTKRNLHPKHLAELMAAFGEASCIEFIDCLFKDEFHTGEYYLTHYPELITIFLIRRNHIMPSFAKTCIETLELTPKDNDDVSYLLSLYPERFDDILEMYGALLDDKTTFSTLMPGQAAALCQRLGLALNTVVTKAPDFNSVHQQSYLDTLSSDQLALIDTKQKKYDIKSSKCNNFFMDEFRTIEAQSPSSVFDAFQSSRYAETSIDLSQCRSCYVGCMDIFIVEFLRRQPLEQVRSLEINEITENSLKTLLDDLSLLFPNLSHLSLPEKYQDDCKHWPYKMHFTPIRQVEIIGQVESQSFGASGFDVSRPLPQLSDNRDLFIANNGLNASIHGESGSFIMTKVAKRLNQPGKTSHRIRTGMIALDLSTGLQTYYRPKVYQRITGVATVSDALIAKLSKDRVNYVYQFEIKALPGEPICLAGVDAHERMAALSVTGDATYTLDKGDDNFYYVTVSNPCDCTYIVSAQSPNDTLDERMIDDEIKAILREYRNRPSFEEVSEAPVGKNRGETDADMHERLFKLGRGSCVERCNAVYFQILKRHPHLEPSIWLPRIDNNHRRLEVISQSGQVTQIDLGGADAVLNYDNRERYVPPSVAQKTPEMPLPQASSAIQTSAPTLQPQAPKRQLVAQSIKIRQWLIARLVPIDIQYMNDIEVSMGKPALLIHSNPELCANHFLSEAKKQGKPVFYLYHPHQLKLDHEQVHLTDNNPLVSMKNALELFMKAHGGQGLLLVNWSAFDAQDRVAFNTVIDESPSLGGMSFNMPVISVCRELPTDMSFKKRHKKIYEVSGIAVIPRGARDDEQELNFQGLPHWQETLFGMVVLHENVMHWQPGLYHTHISPNLQTPTQFILKNAPQKARVEMMSALETAKAQGYFDYHHEKIPFSDCIDFVISPQPFDFNAFKPVAIAYNITAIEVPESALIINTETFDYLLFDKEIRDGQYLTTPGLLAKAGAKPFPLFITSDLSDNQWYCLLHQAEKLNVSLELYLAPGIKTPLSATKPLAISTIDDVKMVSPFITVSKAPRSLLKSDSLAFAVEDYAYQDLVRAIHFTVSDGQFHDFEAQPSEIADYLQQGFDITLYGSFSQQLIHALAALLCHQACHHDLPGRLHLLIDNSDSLELSFLPPQAVVFDNTPPIASKKTVLYEEKTPPSFDLTDSEKIAKDFITARLAALEEAIASHGIIQLIGHTGVGKTHLMKTLKKLHRAKYEVYYGLDGFLAFAADKSGKTKILFLDEVNFEGKHLTFLAPLVNGEGARLLYQGKIITLSPNHRIVCAKNPEDYGGGRVKQKLFTDYDIPALHLDEMPAAFIYENILKPAYGQHRLAQNEAAFKAACSRFLETYTQRKAQKTQGICVRDLEEWVLKYALHGPNLRDSQFFSAKTIKTGERINSDFILTPSIQPIYEALKDAITIRQQRHLDNSKQTIGLNGFLLEGKPGMGKTEMIRFVLKQMGCHKDCIKIDASSPVEKINAIFEQAFQEGKLVWLDEVNSRMDAGFEQRLNAFSSGIHPDTHKKAARPGFMLLVTANSISMEGRDLIGPAFRGRLNCHNMPVPKACDMLAIIKEKAPDLDEDAQVVMAEDLARIIADGHDFSLRDVVPEIPAIAEVFFGLKPQLRGALS